MLRTNRLEENESKLSSSTEGQDDDISEVSRMIDGLSLVDFNIDEEDSEPEVCAVDTTKEKKIDKLESRILDWKKNTHNTVSYGMEGRNMHNTRGGKNPLLKRKSKMVPLYTGERPKEYESRFMALARSTTLEAQEVHPRLMTETEVESSLEEREEPVRQDDEKGLGNLSMYNLLL
jgi:hypothetical protein